ncbi:MAG: sigma-70 family RNA polymerase sigma factor [Actinomycetota bacterium]|nr:sigma-70 family RNA polymerase sigma factor [Actinomycetota bacterium]
MGDDAAERFTAFVESAGARLRQAFISMYGPDVGAEATSEALAYAWENWTRLEQMKNPAGYLYRVGQSKARRYRRKPMVLPSVPDTVQPWVEPGLPAALERISERQRLAVLLCHGFDWTLAETAELMGVTPSTVQRHLDRGLAKVRRHLGVKSDA